MVTLLIPVWLPIMMLIALWVAVTSPGPIFYQQPRIGFKGRRFMLIKFRTMKVNAETHIHEAYLEHLIVSDRPMIKLDATGDPRLIPGGKIFESDGSRRVATNLQCAERRNESGRTATLHGW